MHESDVMPQLLHAAPSVPHAEDVGVVHVDPEQQPDGQVPEPHPLQTPPVQVSGLGQLEHMPPPDPQSPGVLPGWHCPMESQHPEGHEVELQTHLAPEQTWPVEQAVPPPHVHFPVAEQPSAVLPQLTQTEAPIPQAEADGTVHVEPGVDPEQQPLGHDPGSQRHTPPEQT
jgi:hypothetical protein